MSSPELPPYATGFGPTAIEWLERFGSAPRCIVCRHDDWDVTEPVALPAYPYEVEGWRYTPNPDVVYPVFQIICKTCGFTMLFNAIRAGLIQTPSATGGKTASSGTWRRLGPSEPGGEQ